MKWRDFKGLLFLVLEIKKGLSLSHIIVEYLGDCRTSCTSVNCFCQKFCHFSSGRDTFYFPKSVPPWIFLTSVSESLKDTVYHILVYLIRCAEIFSLVACCNFWSISWLVDTPCWMVGGLLIASWHFHSPDRDRSWLGIEKILLGPRTVQEPSNWSYRSFPAD